MPVFTIATLALSTLAFAEPALQIVEDDLVDDDEWMEAEELGVVLERPRDYRHNGFAKMATCAGSGAREHCMAQMTVNFQNACADVAAEVSARGSMQDGWKDPHNNGKYSVMTADANYIKIKRRTGNNKYMDIITFALSDSGSAETAGCTANVCSVSQGNSNNDAGTNMCNMEDLFCNSATNNGQNGVACKVLKTDLAYTIPYLECGRMRGDGRYREHNCQAMAATCLKNPSFETNELSELSTILSRPRDYRNNAFKKMATCANSGAREHCMAQMTVSFQNTCADVAGEVTARGSMTDGWKDPHNNGKYSVLTADANYIKIKRRTGNNKYMDIITFALTGSGTTEAAGCTANVCSVSQGNSNNDAGTNMCNMMDLFCNSATENAQDGVKCKTLKTDLAYTVPYLECGRMRGDGRYREHNCQNFAATCLKNPSNQVLEIIEQDSFDSVDADSMELDELSTMLSRPRDYRHNGFAKMATCSNSGAREHCMAQMTASFTNSCADVAAEVTARASGTGGWKDPHNAGHYSVESADANLLKIKRRTGNNKYMDIITFALSASGATEDAGCTANICSVSQGNSNNDAGTNMCNMMDLFCNSATKNPQNGIACKPVKTDLAYTVPYLECGRDRGDGRYREHNCQNMETTCLKNPSTENWHVLRTLFSE